MSPSHTTGSHSNNSTTSPIPKATTLAAETIVLPASDPTVVNNRKRSRSTSPHNNNSNNVIDNNEPQDTKMKRQSPPPPSSSPPRLIDKMRLEAIFHPKFENENQSDQQIRNEMIASISSSSGYLEVTLKHSGSLLLWSGGQRYYSKNSTCNKFTGVGEILLRQHFVRAWGCNADSTTTTTDDEWMYNECSNYIQTHRLTLSFEVVCSELGHHGDIPLQDYMILLAVADRTTGTFFTTPQIMEFAQRFRLPHNDTWLFRSMTSVESLFDLYDSSRETGLAGGVIGALNGILGGVCVWRVCIPIVWCRGIFWRGL